MIKSDILVMKSRPCSPIDISDLQKLFSAVASPLLLIDLQSEEILFLNHPAEELTGYDEFTMDKKSLILGLFPEQQTKLISAILELARTQGNAFSARENDIELKRKSGRHCPINLSAAILQHHGRDLLVMTLEDLTQVKRNEKEHQALLQRAAHDAKLVDIGRLAAGMAHELNNPLAILDGFSESLEDLIMSEDFNPALMRKNILPIRKSTQRMSQIVSKMMGKIRGQNSTKETKSLQQVVQEALIILEHITKAQSIRLTVNVKDLYVKCDATQIEQIITNIVMNAFNALESRKEGREIRITSVEKSNSHILEIWNNGESIPEDVQEKIFTPFFTTKQPGEGTGLGLFMSFNIMKAHSGELSFKSEKNSGTSFYLTFPKAEARASTSNSKKENKVLVVDEDLFFRKHIIKKLKHLNLEAVEAGNATEAWQQIQFLGSTLNLVLINEQCAFTTAFNLLEKIQEVNPSLRHVLILTDANTLENTHECLIKPVRTEDLAKLLRLNQDSLKKSQAS